MRRGETRAIALVSAALFVAAALSIDCGRDAPPADDSVPLPERNAAEADLDGGAIPVGEGGSGAAGCDPQKPFGKPTLVAGLDVGAHLATPRLSQDELAIYFTMRAGRAGGGTQAELGRAVRSAPTEAFGMPEALGKQNSNLNDNDPSVSGDHLSLWFHSNRSGNQELWVATRGSVGEPFGAPVVLPSVNTDAGEAHAYYRAAGSELWFASTRGGDWDIYVAKLQGKAFSDPVRVTELASPEAEYLPAPSEDGLRILFSSTRSGGKGGVDLWLATRASTNDAFDPPKSLDELNTADAEHAGWISPDGCRIYFSSSRDTAADPRHRLWFAARPK
jgi:Tol biopolymer transport system component